MSQRILFLFDVDGTLVSTEGAGLRALARAFDQIFGMKDPLTSIIPSGKTDCAIFREIIQKRLSRDMTTDEREKLIPPYLLFLEDEISQSNVRMFPGVETFVSELAQRPDIGMGLGTGNLEKGARLKLGPTGLNPHFSFGGFGSDSEDRAELLEAGRKKAENFYGETINPNRTYVIGDTHLDIKAATKAGFKTIAVATGRQSAQELRENRPLAAFENLLVAQSFIHEIIGTMEKAQ